MSKVISVSLDEFDLKLLDELSKEGDFKNRSLLVKKCIMLYALNQIGEKKFSSLLKKELIGEEK